MSSALARHILVATRERAEQLKQQLAEGADFATLAKKHSTCASRKRGGDLGQLRPGQLLRAVDQVVFGQPLHRVHGPVKSRFGYHLIEVIYRG